MRRRTMHFAVACLAAGMAFGTFPARADSPLGKEMELIDSAYKRLKKTTDVAEGLKEARDGQTATLKAAALLPAMVEKMPAGQDKDKAAAAYKTMMGELYLLFCRVETAFLDRKAQEAVALLEQFKELKKKGHTRFVEEDEE